MFIYVISSSENGPVKIGYSAKPEGRLKQLQTGYPAKLKLYFAEAIDNEKLARSIEKRVHANIGHRKLSGEWFDLTVTDAMAEVRFGRMSF